MVTWRAHHLPPQVRVTDLEKLSEGFVCRQLGNAAPVIECQSCKVPVTPDKEAAGT